MTVLVLAARDDWPTDRVVAALADRGAPVFRMDTADFPGELRLTARIDAAVTWHGPLSSPVRTTDLSDVTAVYYRAPGPFSFPEKMSGTERRFAAAQARAGLGGLINAIDGCRWLNHPVSMSRAEYKPLQLKAARDAGLAVAPTLITNEPHAVREFADEVGGDLVCKPVASPVLIGAVAGIKLAVFGLDRHIDWGIGAYGEDADPRPALVRIALARAKASPVDTVVIGDTPADMAGAHASGVPVIGVATGRSDPRSLQRSGADTALMDLGDTDDLVELVLRTW